MTPVTIHEAKTHLSRLIKQVLAGNEVTIANGKVAVVKLVPVNPLSKPKRELGWLAHEKPPGSKGILDNGFWDPMPEDELALWNGESLPADPLYSPPTK